MRWHANEMLHEIEFDIFAIMRWNSFEGQKAIEKNVNNTFLIL